MLSPTRGWLRAARAVSFGPPVFLLLAGLIGLAALLLTSVRLSPFRVGVSLCAMQVVLHETFMTLERQT